MRRVLILMMSTMVATAALAKPPSKMTESELVDQLLNHASSGKRGQAADELRDRRTPAVGALRQACRPQETDDGVCDRALFALEKLRTAEAKQAMASVVLDDTLAPNRRRNAARGLSNVDEAYLGRVALQALTRYRSLQDGLVKMLVKTLPASGVPEAADMAVVIATDTGADRGVRRKALEVAEQVQHPRLADVWVALLDDPDKKVRQDCAQNLGGGDLPTAVVQPALAKVARYDDKGDVRAAAMKSLRNHASAELVPLLNHAVVNERHMMAWYHAFAMFEALADGTSVGALQSLFRNEFIMPEHHIALIHAALRVGDPAVVPSLRTLADQTEDEQVRVEALDAIRLLEGPQQALVSYVAGIPLVDVVVVDVGTQVVAPAPALSVQVDATGAAVWAPGVSVELDLPTEWSVETW